MTCDAESTAVVYVEAQFGIMSEWFDVVSL